MTILRQIVSFFLRLNEFVGQLLAGLNLVLVLLICGDVALRYAFNATTVAIIELEWHLFALIFLLGMGYAYRHDRHVRVDVFYCQFSPRVRAWVNLLGGLLFLTPFCLVAIYTAYRFAAYSFLFREGSPNPGGLPARYLIKSAITIGFALLFWQNLLVMARALTIIRGKQEAIFENDSPSHQT
ncbi:MAG: TRAP transporter small permease subunit [Microscillaceae bacterium]|nr:TRAP transporter small permease subunit [Microscillaceae bacterium]